MATLPTIPRPQSVLVDAKDWPTSEWFNFWNNFVLWAQENGATAEQIAEINARIAALEAQDSVGIVRGEQSIFTVGVLPNVVTVTLVNDEAAPGNTYYYGTGPTGTKGFFAVADAITATQDGIELVTGPDGVTDIRPDDDLAEVEALATTGLATRIATNVWTTREVMAGTGISVANGTGVLGHPTVSHGDTSSVSNLTSDNSGVVVLQDIAFTFDTFGHVLTATVGTVNVATALASTFQPLDVTLIALAGQNWAANAMPLGTGADTVTQLALAANTFPGRSSAGNVSAKPITDDALALLADADVPRLGTANTWSAAQTINADVVVDTDTFVVDTINNRVGIGIATPQFQFDVRGPTAGIRLMRTGGAMPFISFGTDDLVNGGQIRGNVASEMLRFTNNSGGTTWVLVENTQMASGSDNSRNLGSAALRWKEVFSAIGVINTSDAREKTEVAPFTAAELAAAVELARSVGTYQWLASIIAKGADARTHIGLTVQRAIEIMQSHGLDPLDYGFICYDHWDETPEIVDPETGEISQPYQAAGDRYSFRHDQLLLFIARGHEERLMRLETLIAD